MKIYSDIEKSLLEAIEMEKGNVALVEKENMPALTYEVSDKDKELIDEMVRLRKKENISQQQLAKMTGNKQQAISRIEKKENSPSLRTYCAILQALGYELQIVKNSDM